MALTAEQVTEQLRALRPGDEAGLQALARQLRDDATRGPSAAAVALALGPDHAMATKAADVLGMAPDATFAALLRAAPPADPARRLWRLQTLVDTELAARARLALVAAPLLDDTTLLPLPGGQRAEGEPPPARVCDRAYLLLRELLKLDDAKLDRLVAAKVFLHLPVADKDSAIAEFRRSGTWMNVLAR